MLTSRIPTSLTCVLLGLCLGGVSYAQASISLELRPGHSGGPLVDVQGRLVGINTMMAGPEVGMAVPVHVVKEFLRQELGSEGAGLLQ